MTEFIDAIRNDSLLQAISIVVALVTAVYYCGKATLFIGKNLWRKISPTLGNRLDKWSAERLAKTELALNDPIFLVVEVGRRVLLALSFVTVYFVLAVGGLSDTDKSSLTTIERTSRLILISVSFFQIGSIAGWLTALGRKRLKEAGKDVDK
jgi:hypothetical protein